ncbi:MAG: NAD(P)H-dependent oxidoreductase [Pseudomonadota bacterium]
MTDQSNVLVILAHPALEKSRCNRPMATRARYTANVTVHDLYEHYPDFYIDKAREQALITEHDVLVLQFPLYWYSAPALLKEWIDIVFEHGFAYGRHARGLAGRTLVTAWTAGSSETQFVDEQDQSLIPSIMQPFAATARYCGLHYLPPWCTLDTGSLTAGQIDTVARRYAAMLQRLQWPTFRARDFEGDITLNASLDRLQEESDA